MAVVVVVGMLSLQFLDNLEACWFVKVTNPFVFVFMFVLLLCLVMDTRNPSFFPRRELMPGKFYFCFFNLFS